MDHEGAPEITIPSFNLLNLLERIIFCGIIFILALPLLGDYGVWLFPIGRDVIFKLTVEFLLILALAFWSLNHWDLFKNSKLKIKNLKTPITLSLLSFWIIMLLATLNSVQMEFSIWGNIYKNQGLMTWTHYLLFFFLLIGFLREKRQWQFLIQIAMFVGTLVGLIALWQALQNGFDARAASTLNNSNYLAAYLVLLLPITFAFSLRNKSLLLGSAAAIQFLAHIATQTRGGYLGIAIAIFMFALLYTRRKKILILPVLAIVSWLLIVISPLGQSFQQKLPNFTDRFLNYQNIRSDSSPRLEAWQAGWQGMRARPLLGYGPENFFAAFAQFYSGSQDHAGSLAKEGSLWESWFDKAHNFIFDIGVTTGFLGLLSYLAIFASTIWLLYRKLSVMRIGLIAAFAGYLAQNLLGFDTIIPGIYLMFLLGYTHFITNYNSSQPPLTLRGGAPPLRVRGACLPAGRGWGELLFRTILMAITLVAISLFIFSSKIHTDILKANRELNLADFFARNKQVEQSFVALEKGLEYNAPSINPNIRHRYAIIALAYYDAVAKLCNFNVDLKCKWLYGDSKKHLARALILQQENAVTEWPHFTRNYIYAAQISHILGDFENSDLFFKKALKLSPGRISIQAEWDRLKTLRNE